MTMIRINKFFNSNKQLVASRQTEIELLRQTARNETPQILSTLLF